MELTAAEMRAVNAGAKRAHRAGRELVPVEDLKQEAYVWLFERPHTIERWREEKKSAQKIQTVSYRVGVEAVRREQRQIGQTQRVDQWQADVGLLEELLPDALAGPVAWTDPGLPPEESKRGKSSPAEGNNHLALMVDVSRAFDSLNDQQQFVLRALVVGDSTQQGLADDMELDRNQIRRIKKRALNEMLDYLGGLGFSSGGRRVHRVEE